MHLQLNSEYYSGAAFCNHFSQAGFWVPKFDAQPVSKVKGFFLLLSSFDSALVDIQWKPLNVITLGQTQSDNINRMITLTDYKFLWISINFIT
jgi:hypothetical protein